MDDAAHAAATRCTGAEIDSRRHGASGLFADLAKVAPMANGILHRRTGDATLMFVFHLDMTPIEVYAGLILDLT
jgi:hypothetical protein